MSLSGTLSNALSGLNAAARGAQVVSSNVSNALTEGYGRRVLETSAASLGGTGAGVRVDGVRREVDLQLLSDRRLAQAGSGQAEARADALAQIEAAMGRADEEDSISGRIAAFESALVTAASRPDSDARLADVLGAAQAVADRIAAASDDIQTLRVAAETAIANDVETLNTNLARIADLNVEIRSRLNGETDATGLMDQRQVLVDQLAEIVPLRQLQRDDGMIALYSETGATLLDGQPAEFGFTSHRVITADMSADSGALGGLTLNGEPVKVSGGYAPMGGGRLEALFEQRDVLAPSAQSDLDALARDMIERFQDAAVDPTLTPGEAGLFTDNGVALDLSDPATEVGLAGRISVNTLADPAAGGAVWHLRSGLGASATPVEVGDARLLNSLADALTESRDPASGRFTGQSYTAADLASETVSRISLAAVRAAEEESFATSRTSALREAELQQGVDTDAQLQDLMMFEQAYAANAKVIQTVDGMIRTLLEI